MRTSAVAIALVALTPLACSGDDGAGSGSTATPDETETSTSGTVGPATTTDDPMTTGSTTMPDGETTAGSSTTDDPSGGSSGDTTTGPTATGPDTTGSTGSGDTGSGSGSGSSGESSESSGGAAMFDHGEPFGDDVQELDLVGTWGLNWDEDQANLMLTVNGDGTFRLIERDVDCKLLAEGSGSMWVEGQQIAFHFAAWTGQPLWDTETVLGEPLVAPFRMRSSFSLQGDTTAYLGIVAPAQLLADGSFSSRSLVRLSTVGGYLAGQWQGEASLEMIIAGETAPVLAVIDSQKSFLDEEFVPATAEGTGTYARDRTWYPTPLLESIYENFNWTCLDGCTMPAGTTFVAGTNLYTYGPYAGQTHMMALESGRSFQRDIVQSCE